MSLPSGFQVDLRKDKVCRLKKSLYRFKNLQEHGLIEWFEKVDTSFEFLQSQADHTKFYKHSTNKKSAILILYVDDIFLQVCQSRIHHFKEKACKCISNQESRNTRALPRNGVCEI